MEKTFLSGTTNSKYTGADSPNLCRTCAHTALIASKLMAWLSEVVAWKHTENPAVAKSIAGKDLQKEKNSLSLSGVPHASNAVGISTKVL